MATSPFDTLSIEAVAGSFATDAITSIQLRRSITTPGEVNVELGDTGTYAALKEDVAMGSEFRIVMNDRPFLQGRIEMRDAPVDAMQASVLRFAVRTKITDALYGSADPKIRIKNVSIKQFVLAAYEELGLTEKDFVFDPAAARDLLTGKSTKGGAAPPDLDELKEDQAKIRPPETVFSAVDRHLRRHGLMHWDSSDGRIIVGKPDQDQDPIYTFRCFRGANGAANNVLAISRAEDVSDAASSVGVFGWGGGRDYQKAKVSGLADEDRVLSAGFYRPVVIVDEGIKTQAQAERRAKQERARRARKIDMFRVDADGLAFDDGRGRINFEIDTTAEIMTDAHGGAFGKYYVEEIELRRDPQNGDSSRLTLVGPGVWVL